MLHLVNSFPDAIPDAFAQVLRDEILILDLGSFEIGCSFARERNDLVRKQKIERGIPLERFCEAEGCGRKYLARGLCQLHYQRLQKSGRFKAVPA